MKTHFYIPWQKKLLKLLFVLIVIAHSFSIQGQNIVNPNHQFEENFEREYEDQNLINSVENPFDTKDIQSNNDPFRNEINGNIWVRDSVHSYYKAQRDRWRSFVVKRDTRGNPLHCLALRSENLSKNGPWINDIQSFNKYDVRNNETERYYTYWNKSKNSWINESKEIVEYNDENIFTSSIMQIWVDNSNSWVNSKKTSQEVDKNGNITRFQRFTWDENLIQWIISAHAEYIYQNNNLLQKELVYKWHEKSQDWIINRELLYTYNVNNLISTKITSSFDTTTSQMEQVLKHDFQYNKNDSLILKTKSLWDKIKMNWKVKLIEDYKYDSSNNLISYVKSILNTKVNSFFNQIMKIYTYDENDFLTQYWADYKLNDLPENKFTLLDTYTNNTDGHPIYQHSQFLDTITGKWENSWQQFIQYDSDKRVIENLSTDWNAKDSTWILYSKETNKFNDQGHQIEEIIYYWGNTNWVEQFNISSFWSEFELTSIEEEEIYLNIYPNPVNDQLIIEMDDGNQIISVILFDQMGKLLTTKINARGLDVSSIQPGTYYIHINTAHGSVTRKIVKQ